MSAPQCLTSIGTALYDSSFLRHSIRLLAGAHGLRTVGAHEHGCEAPSPDGGAGVEVADAVAAHPLHPLQHAPKRRLVVGEREDDAHAALSRPPHDVVQAL